MSKRECIENAKERINVYRSESIGRMENNVRTAKESVPGYTELEAALSSIGMRIFTSAISRDGSFETVKEEYDFLNEKKKELLEEFGFPADFCDIKYHCEKCNDTGYVGIKMCDCLKREISKELLKESGLYSLAERQNFGNFSLGYYESEDRILMEKNVEILKTFVKNFEPGKSESYVLLGGTGLGKTHLSTATALEVVGRGFFTVYETAINMFDVFESEQFGRSDKHSNYSVADYYDADLLILDDLGTELTNQFTVSCLYGIINSRIITHKSTIINTNLNYGELMERYSDRIVSRLFGEYNILTFRGTDIRMQKLQNNLT